MFFHVGKYKYFTMVTLGIKRESAIEWKKNKQSTPMKLGQNLAIALYLSTKQQM